MNRIAWMAHPLGGDVENNLRRAKRWLLWCWRTFSNVDFCAGWIPCCEVMNDADPDDRERGLAFDCAAVARLDDYWMVGGRVSEGMRRERDAAIANGKRVVDLTELGPEPPLAASALVVDTVSRAVASAGYNANMGIVDNKDKSRRGLVLHLLER